MARRCLRKAGRTNVTKSNLGSTILQAAGVVLSGRSYFAIETQERLILKTRRGKFENESGQTLTDRELEILSYIGLGETKRQIAERIGRSANTVEAHRTNIKRKLGMDTNAELIRYAALHCPAASIDKSGN